MPSDSLRVALIDTKPTFRAQYLLERFERGIRSCGDDTFWVRQGDPLYERLKGCDVAVQVCIANRWHQESANGLFRVAVAQTLRELGKRLVVIDTGFVKNQTDYELDLGASSNRLYFSQLAGQDDLAGQAEQDRFARNAYYQVGFDGIKRHSACYCQGAPADRWLALQTPLAPYRAAGLGGHLLVLGQTFHGLSSQHIDLYAWYAKLLRQVGRYSDRVVVFRQHPRLTKMRQPGKETRGKGPEALRSRAKKDRTEIIQRLKGPPGKVRLQFSGNDKVAADLVNAHAVLAFSTNASVAAVLGGVPLFVGDPSNMAWDAATPFSVEGKAKGLSLLENPPRPERQAWAQELAYCQWNPQEMEEGAPWRHLRPHARKSPGQDRPSGQSGDPPG